MWVLLLRVLAMTPHELNVQIQMIRNFVGQIIDDGVNMNLDDMNELWQWLDDLLGRTDQDA
jgi:hypothetical protein